MKNSKVVCVTTSIRTMQALVIFVRRKYFMAGPTARSHTVSLPSLRRLTFILNENLRHHQKHTYVLNTGWTVHLLDRFA